LVIHKAPPHLTKKEFEAKLEGIIDEVALPPVVQKLLKLEIVRTAHIDCYPRQNKYLCSPIAVSE
jgi:hypothetical protein